MFESVEKFRNIHKGKKAYVLGAGPSLSKYNMDKIIGDDIVFSCNLAILAVSKSNYFVFTDNSVPYYNYYNRMANISENVIFAGRGIDKKFYYNDINGYNENIKFNGKKHLIDRRYDSRGLPFIKSNEKNISNFDYKDGKLIDGSDCVMVATHLAYICGCEEIILVGVDLIWDNNEKYFKKFDELKQMNDRYKYIDINHLKQLDSGTSGGLKNSYLSWKKIVNENENDNLKKIKNANPKGLLSEFFDTKKIN